MALVAQEKGSRRIACNYCKQKKIRCDGDTPCWNCLARQEKCQYPPMRPSRDRRRSQAGKALEKRLAQLEELILQSRPRDMNGSLQNPDQEMFTTVSSYRDTEISPHLNPSLPYMMNIVAAPGQSEAVYLPSESHSLQDINVDTIPCSPFLSERMTPALEQPACTTTPTPQPPFTRPSAIATPLHSKAISPLPRSPYSQPTDDEGERNNSIMAPAAENAYEDYRLGSLLSVLSSAGVAWVSEHTGPSHFNKSAQILAADITSRQWPHRKGSFGREPEPVEEEALRFCKAYFENTLESVMGIVHRQTFEERLRLHFGGESSDDDPGWYALRNAVYASGCRAEYSKACHSMAFEEAQDRGWRFLKKALSVQTELLYGQTDISAVQALVAMCYFIEGMGNQTLEYSLSSSALLLAQAKGLHHQGGNIDSNGRENPHRNWLFWAIYCYSTHLAWLSGRPPILDDDIITCHLPVAAPEGSTINIELFTSIIKLCKVCSKIFAQLSAMKALSQRPDELIRIVQCLELQLTQWRDSLPSYLQPGAPIDPSQLPAGTHHYHVIWLHSYYYSSKMAIHSVFAYPWNSTIIGLDNFAEYQIVSEQVVQSSQDIIEAARNIILVTRNISINPSLPGSMLLYYPLIGFMNCFIHIVKYPTLATNQSDIALMDMVMGHFGHLGFLSSSETTFLSLRGIVMLALATMDEAREQGLTGPMIDMLLKNDNGLSDMATFVDTRDISGMDSMIDFGGGFPY